MTTELRTSERRMFKRCQYKWMWAYKDRLKPLRESNPLWFGQAVHLALAEWDKPGKKRGVHPAKTFVEVLESNVVQHFENTDDFDAKAEYIAHLDMGVDMMNRYVEFYGNEEDWEVIAPEMTFQVRIPQKDGSDKFRYVGTVDAVKRYIGPTSGEMRHGSIWLWEHKTAASIQVHHLPLDDQAGSYWAIVPMVLRKKGVLKPGETIDGILYNFLRKAPDDPRPKNADGLYCNKPTKQNFLDTLTEAGHKVSATMKVEELQDIAKEHGVKVLGDVSKTQPPPYFERIPVFRTPAEQKTQLRRIQDEQLQISLVSSGKLPPTKNPTRDCSWDCEFFRMCQLHEAGADWEEYRDTTFKTWDPYEDHQKSA